MHIHQPINVSSARLDEQWGNNHLICIARSHGAPFLKAGIRRGWVRGRMAGREGWRGEAEGSRERWERPRQGGGAGGRGEEVTSGRRLDGLAASLTDA